MEILKCGWLRHVLSMILLLGIIMLIFSCRSTNRLAVISKEDALKDYDAMWISSYYIGTEKQDMHRL